MVRNSDIGDLTGMRYRIQATIKLLAMPSGVKKEILDAVEEIHMPFYKYSTMADIDVWDAYKKKVLTQIVGICTANGVNRLAIERITDRIKLLAR